MSPRRAALFAAVLLLAGAPAGSAEESLVLIVSADSPVTRLEIIEVRKLFLGFSVIRGDLPLQAVENRSDERLHDAFLQNVLAMSERAYEKRLLSMALQQGSRRPVVYTTTPALLAAVAADPRAVSVAWAREAAQEKRVRVLRVLWRD